MKEERLGRNRHNVYRVGDTVVRDSGPWSKTVHTLLRHLNEVGFNYAPKPLGFDAKGREVLTYMPGESVTWPWKEVIRQDHGLRQVTGMLKKLHEATIDLQMPESTVWKARTSAKSPGQIIRHGDIGPWNTIWQHDTLTALIDWEAAEPGDAITDVAQLAWYYIPLRDERGWRKSGFESEPDFSHRLDVICSEYGSFTPQQVISELDRLQNMEITRAKDLGSKGLEPWNRWLKEGDVDEFEKENAWLHGFAQQRMP